MKKLSLALSFFMVVFNLHLHAQCFTCDNIINVAGASQSGNVSAGCKPSPAGSNFGCQGYRINATTTPAILPGATMFYETGNGGSCSTGGQSSVFVEVDSDCTPPTPVGVGEVSTSGEYFGTLAIPAGAAEVIVYVCRSTGGGNPNLCNISMVGTTSVTSTPVICLNDGTITAVGTITGQLVGTITYSIDGVGGSTANTTGVFTGLPAGNYTVTVYDSGATTHFDETTVTVGAGVGTPTATATATAALCNGGNGKITLTIANGTAPYDIAWNGPGANDGTANNQSSGYMITALPAGNYAITVTDENGCMTTTSSMVTEPAALTATATATAALCNGGNGKITLTIAGGTAPYDIAWNGPGANDGTANNQASGYMITALPAGNYAITVTDENGCMTTTSSMVTEPAALTATATATAALCNGGNGKITLTIAGGTAPYDIAWNGPGANDGTANNQSSGYMITALPAGNYAITVTDENGCMTTTSSMVTEPAALTATATATAALCNGGNGKITLTIAGGTAPYDIAWNGPGANDGTANNQSSGYMITALPAGNYAITVTDENGCMTTTSSMVTEPAAPTATATATAALCNGGNGKITLTIAGGTAPYDIAWNGPGANDGTANNQSSGYMITALPAGNYAITVTDENGCMTTTSSMVTEPAALTATATATAALCNGGNGKITLTIAGGTAPYDIAWNGPGANDGTANNQSSGYMITALPAGNYAITVTDENGCMTTTSSMVTEPAALTATATATAALCNGGNGKITLTIAGGTAPYDIAWNGPGANDGTANNQASGYMITALPAGSYAITVTDENGCMTTTSSIVTEPDPLVVTCPPNATRCAGDASFALTGGDPAGGTYSGTGVTAGIFDPSAAGIGVHTINYTYTNGNGCTDDCDFTVEVLGDCCTGPIAECKPATVILIGNTVTILPADVDNGSTADCGLACLSVLPGQFDCSDVGTPQTVILKVLDVNGDIDECEATVTVLDPTPPMIACPANIVRSTDPGQCSAVVSYANPVFSDNCSATLTLVSGLPSGSIFPKGVNIVNWKTTDASGNMAVCAFTVTVNDTQAPTITCPPNIVKNTDPGRCDAVVTYAAPTVSDNCTGATSAVVPPSLPSGSVFPKGPNAVTWEATDGAGLIKRCTFTVTVNDNQPPTITCPSNQAKNTDLNMCSAVVAYAPPATTDNCSGVSRILISGLASNSAFPKGITTVIWKATDGSGLTKTCSFKVTVTDAQAPAITCPSSVVKNTDNNLCSAINSYTTPTFTDNCAGGSVVRTSGLASGSAFPKGINVVVWKATDAVGNTKTCSFTVTVNDMQLPVITCPADIVKSNDPGICCATVSYPAPTGTDNCPGVTVGIFSGLASYSVFPVGTNEVVWKATDASGGTKTCAFKVTVNDTEAPMIMCPGNTTVNGGGTPCTYLFASLPGATYMENCPGTVLTHNAPVNLPSGTTTVTWTATDQANNQSQCAYQVTVQCGTNPSGGSALAARNAVLGTPDAQVQIDLQLAPNPATTAVTAMLSGVGEHGGELLLFDPLGRMVLQQKVAGSQQTVSLDLNSLGISSGLYQVSLRTENGVVTKGLIINRL